MFSCRWIHILVAEKRPSLFPSFSEHIPEITVIVVRFACQFFPLLPFWGKFT